MWLARDSKKDGCNEGSAIYLDYGGEHTNIYMV